MNDNENIKAILKKIGLSENETSVYLIGLKMGPSLASTLSKQAGLQRTLVYHLLDALKEKGLVSTASTEHKKRFLFEPPEKLKELITRKKKEFEEVEQQLEQISVEMRSLYPDTDGQPKIKFYEGVEGMKNVANQVLQSKESKMYGFIAIENIFQVFDETFIRYWSKERGRKNVSSQTIWSKDADIPFLDKLEERRLAPDDIVVKNTIVIFGNKIVSFSSPRNLFAMIMEDDNLAQTLKSIFAYVWKRSVRIS